MVDSSSAAAGTVTKTKVPAMFQAYLTKKGMEKPTVVQAKFWNEVMSGKDAVGIAPTGSGKTVKIS